MNTPLHKTSLMHLLVATALLLGLFWQAAAQAHDARPVVVNIRETLPGIFQSQLKVPPSVEADNLPELVWPQNCVVINDGSTVERNVNLLQCAPGLSGQSFALHYPLFNPSLATYYTLTAIDGSVSSAMLAPTDKAWIVPEAMTRWRVAGEYLQLGVEHILGGLDHLLFVFGLLVIARTAKRVLWTVSGFTLAHSITLSLAALGKVTVPIVPVEAVIALSIVFLAHEIFHQKPDSLTWRYPLLVSFGFGLLHGLGFASALGEIGLAENEAVLSLLFFNVGVELGQLLFIASVAALAGLGLWLLRRTGSYARSASALMLTGKMNLLSAYIIGIPATYWLLERLAQF